MPPHTPMIVAHKKNQQKTQKKYSEIVLRPKHGAPPPPCLGMTRLFEGKNHVFFCILGGVSHVKNSKKMEVGFG